MLKLVLLVVLIISGPLLTIWMLNTLFGLAITYSFTTRVAAAMLNEVLTARK